MHHIFVENDYVDLDKKLIIINGDEDFDNYNHLANSLRVRLNESVLCSVMPFVSAFDYKTRVIEIDNKKIVLQIDEKVECSELMIKLNLYQGLAKADKIEYIIEKAVELGVSSITPLIVTNAIVKIDKEDKKYLNKINRYTKISKSAAEQSKRHIVPNINMPLTIEEAIQKTKNDYNIVFYENAEGMEYTKKIIRSIKDEMQGNSSSKEINIFIGPEGGYTDEEIQKMRESGFYILTLGKRILRTETAALVAITLFMYEFEN